MRLRFGKAISLTAVTAVCLLLASCAQTGPPLPPSLELPKPPTDLRAFRKGNRVTLSWGDPTLTTDRQSVRYLGPTLICRSIETEIAACGSPVGTLPAPAAAIKKSSTRRIGVQKTASARPAPVTFTDTLGADILTRNPAAEITYAIEVMNRNARSAGLSNRVHVPAIATLPPPADLSADLTGDGVVLSWTSAAVPPALAGNSADSPRLQLRYRIYRRAETADEGTPGDKDSGKEVVAGEAPLDGRGLVHFTDSGFEWEKTYLYYVTAVSIIQRADSEVQVEGENSAAVRVVAHDVFPPAVPAGLQAAYSGEGQKPFIDLVWAPVTNVDLAGYNVYRSEESGSPVASSPEKMVKLNSDLVKSPAYRDSAVASGKTYIYAVSAVDVRGNESQRSERASESVP